MVFDNKLCGDNSTWLLRPTWVAPLVALPYDDDERRSWKNGRTPTVAADILKRVLRDPSLVYPRVLTVRLDHHCTTSLISPTRWIENITEIKRILSGPIDRSRPTPMSYYSVNILKHRCRPFGCFYYCGGVSHWRKRNKDVYIYITRNVIIIYTVRMWNGTWKRRKTISTKTRSHVIDV